MQRCQSRCHYGCSLLFCVGGVDRNRSYSLNVFMISLRRSSAYFIWFTEEYEFCSCGLCHSSSKGAYIGLGRLSRVAMTLANIACEFFERSLVVG